jgi:tRNA-splicing ligase RtcB
MAAKGIEVMAHNRKTLVEEAPQAYKDIDRVVDVVHCLGLSGKVARLVPMGVIKG